MNRLLYRDVKTPVARVLNVAPDDPMVIGYVNEAERRLVNKINALGTVQNYRICTSSDGCIAWPRQIDTILAYWLCDTPGTVRNGWYETSINSIGYLDSQDSVTHTLVDRGTACVFDQPNNDVSTVSVGSSLPETVGVGAPRINIRGYDENAQWIRTQDPPASGIYVDGEFVVIANAFAQTIHKFTAITGVVKDVTTGPVLLYQYDTTLASRTRQLAYYEPDETTPIYRCSLIPGLGNTHGCGPLGDGGDAPKRVTVRVKLRHIDAARDDDFLLLCNQAAIKLGVMALLKEERNLLQESVAYMAAALKELDDELHNYEGDGAVPIVKSESSQTWGANVLNPVTLGYRIW